MEQYFGKISFKNTYFANGCLSLVREIQKLNIKIFLHNLHNFITSWDVIKYIYSCRVNSLYYEHVIDKWKHFKYIITHYGKAILAKIRKLEKTSSMLEKVSLKSISFIKCICSFVQMYCNSFGNKFTNGEIRKSKAQ